MNLWIETGLGIKTKLLWKKSVYIRKKELTNIQDYVCVAPEFSIISLAACQLF